MKHSYLTESHTDSVPVDEMVCALASWQAIHS